MKTIRLKWKGNSGESVIVCRKNVLSKGLGAMPRLRTGGALVFTDSNVYALYGKRIGACLPGVPVYVMPAGEEHKNGETLFALLGAMAEAKLVRGSALVAVGGGVVGDVGGLAASLYMRGISCIQVPTTLLAQVDSSVGGKTAIDFNGVKNLVGTFCQPERVFADPAFFETLPPREIRCGLGEIVKHAALSGELFDELVREKNLTDLGFLASVVPKNIAFKADVVRRDPYEKGLRKCLNLGHTTGHAVELTDGTLSHGEAVLVGIVYEARLAARRAGGDAAYLGKLEALCRSVLARDPASVDVASAAHLARLDKKNLSAGSVVATVPVRRGEYALLELPYAEYEAELGRIREELK